MTAETHEILSAREAAEDAQTDALAVLEGASSFAVTTQEEAQIASAQMNAIHVRAKDIEEMRKRLKAPILEAGRAIDEEFRKPLETLERAKGSYKRALDAFLAAERKRAAEEAERARREAEKQRAAIERQQQKAEARGDTEKADQLAYRAATVPVVTPPPAAKVAGVAHTERWVAVLDNKAALVKAIADGLYPMDWLTVDQRALDQQARSLKGSLNIPGVRAQCETGVRPTGRS